MERRGVIRRAVFRLRKALRNGDETNNGHLSDREWAMLEAPRVANPRLQRERSQWTEDNLD